MVDFGQNLVNFANKLDFDKIILKESCQKREKCKGGTRFEGWQQDDIIQILTINTRKPLADKIFQKEIKKGIIGNHYGR